MKYIFQIFLALIATAPLTALATDTPGDQLYWEVALGTPQGVRDLINSGQVPATARSNIGDSALHGVCSRKQQNPKDSIEIADFLIKHGANVNDTGRHGQSILWNCAAGDSPRELIEFLVAHGGNLRLKTPGWQTPCDVLWTDRQALARHFKCPRSKFVRDLEQVGTSITIEYGSGCLNYHPMLHPYCG